MDVNFTVSDDGSQKVVTLPGRLLVPGLLFPFIPREYWRMRVRTGYTRFDWSAGVQGGNFSFTLPNLQARMNVSEWLKLGLLMDVIIDSEISGLRLEIAFSGGTVAFDKVGHFGIDGRANLEGLRSALTALRAIVNTTSLDAEWSISTHELLRQKPQLDILRAAIDGSTVDISATILQDNLPETFESGRVALFKTLFLRFGDSFLCAFFSLTAPSKKMWRPEHNAWELNLKPEKPQLHSFMFLNKDKMKSYPFEQRLKEHADKLGDAVELSLIPRPSELSL